MDRDRAVDESDNQIAVFGRIGAPPLNVAEAQRMIRRPDGGLCWTSNDIFDTRVFKVLGENGTSRVYSR